MIRIPDGATSAGRVSEWVDDLQLLDDRAGSTVRDDKGHRVAMLGARMEEMHV